MAILDQVFEPTCAQADQPRTMPVHEAFNGTIVSSAICAATQLGLLDEIAAGAPVDIGAFTARRGLRRESVEAVAAALAHADIVRFAGPATQLEVLPGKAFSEAWVNKGYFRWLFGGYGQMLSRAAELCHGSAADTAAATRDGAQIAMAGQDYGRQFVDPIFNDLLDSVEFSRVVDLGCGSAQRLIDLAIARPGTTCLGVERDAGAVEVARAAIRRAGVDGRVEIAHGDITTLEDGRFPSFELIFSFFLGHDLWPRDHCLQVMDRLYRAFPDARTFLLSDTYRSGEVTRPSVPIFTLGFEYTHALMTQDVPSVEEWRALFEESSWHLVDSFDLAIPYSVVFMLAPDDKRSTVEATCD